MKWYLWVLIITSDGSTFFETEFSGLESCQKAKTVTILESERKYDDKLILVATECKTHPRPNTTNSPLKPKSSLRT